jgi:hypothetical protein
VDLAAVVASSTLVAAVVGSVAGYVSQRALAKGEARIGYEYKARSRLYEAIGPLRFQLLMACRDVARRVLTHTLHRDWPMDPAGDYGSSTLHRLLRPLAICTLIDRRMNAADFSVDPSSIRLLRFEIGAYRMLTGADPLPYYADLDWRNQSQHVARDNLRRAAARLIRTDAGGEPYVMDYAEFLDSCPDPLADKAVAPLARLLKETNGSLTGNPVFWVRLVGYAYLCQRFIDANGSGLGFTQRVVDVRSLVAATDDPEINAHLDEQEQIYQRIVDEDL